MYVPLADGISDIDGSDSLEPVLDQLLTTVAFAVSYWSIALS